mmetsp:Transcript_51030/g.137317  ORF Transcript_51030/g.137317 Transcript_51030/m.137317 type:complete len:234 (+) Transcript_51030:1136-1837(+)
MAVRRRRGAPLPRRAGGRRRQDRRGVGDADAARVRGLVHLLRDHARIFRRRFGTGPVQRPPRILRRGVRARSRGAAAGGTGADGAAAAAPAHVAQRAHAGAPARPEPRRLPRGRVRGLREAPRDLVADLLRAAADAVLPGFGIGEPRVRHRCCLADSCVGHHVPALPRGAAYYVDAQGRLPGRPRRGADGRLPQRATRSPRRLRRPREQHAAGHCQRSFARSTRESLACSTTL